MKVARNSDGSFTLTAGQDSADTDLIDAIANEGFDAFVRQHFHGIPASAGGYQTTGVTLLVDGAHPSALEAKSGRQILRAVRELFRLGLGEDALHSHIGLDTPNPQTQDKLAALLHQFQLMLDVWSIAVRQSKSVRQEMNGAHGTSLNETAIVEQQGGTA